MIASALLAFVLSGVFMAIGAWYTYRMVRPAPGPPPSRADRVSSVAHIVMSWGMVPMVWAWGMGMPIVPQVVVFGAASAWFMVLAVSRAPEACCSLFGRKRTALYHLHHFSLMAAMVWMVLAMSMPVLTSSSAGAESSMSMAGMDHSAMSGGQMDHMEQLSVPVTQATQAGPPPIVAGITIALAVYCLVMVPWWVYEGVAVRKGRGRRKQRREATMQAGIHAVKCGGMALMLIAMA
jgi:hypothetical protein